LGTQSDLAELLGPGCHTKMSDDEHSEREKAGESVGARTPRNSQAAVASRRLDQLSSHLKPSNAGQPPSTGAQDPPHTSTGRRKRKPRSQVEALPPDYSDILSHVKTLKCIASTPDPTNRGYIRQKTAGKLWVRERIDVLLDENSFQEIGSISGTATWKVDPTNNTEMPETFVLSNNPQGFGTLTCPRTRRRRRILLTVDDFSI